MNKFSLLTIVALALLAFSCQNESAKSTDSAQKTSLLGEKMTKTIPPDQLLGQLFHDVQMAHVFPDSKTFADCQPVIPVSDLLKKYDSVKGVAGFDLKKFVAENFEEPKKLDSGFRSDFKMTAAEHVSSLWPVLTRAADGPQKEGSSLLPLPKSYVVPGGRFREIYYWDSYFTMLGLRADGRVDLIESMIQNFAHLIDQYGHIPNGSRAYYLSRSQPPFFSLMVRLLDDLQMEKPASERPIVRFLPQMERELAFWMEGAAGLEKIGSAHRRIVLPAESMLLNRYFDDSETPRAESYFEDIETAKKAEKLGQKPAEVYRNLKAAAESGWDFSSRWFADGQNLETIHTTDIVPIDLNCLIYHLQKTIADAYFLKNDIDKSTLFSRDGYERTGQIENLFWNPKTGFYHDFDFKKGELTASKTLAAVFPLYFEIASAEHAKSVAQVLEKEFLRPGGLATTLARTGQQWDAPNAWPPLIWISIRGLEKYGHKKLADQITARWLALNENVYKNTGKMMEKYRTDDISLPTGGGEYPVQDGFGWTNGVYLDLKKGRK